ncbi:TAF4 domain-containing protein [Haematococcus lacustris]|uniref:TAF4 domain-containing protein n=1 Tax=Haematococcus lacustris TaxID=44745 RepID=A0A699ZXX5_HAELA|nr:TAF4 domain-containing protein [Haematococcus lacustris]
MQGVAPACFYLLEEAVTQHLAQLLKGMAKAARQRADPARDVTGMRKWGVNVRAGISKYIKDDKQGAD